MKLENLVNEIALKIINEDMKQSEKSACIEKAYAERVLENLLSFRSFWLLVCAKVNEIEIGEDD